MPRRRRWILGFAAVLCGLAAGALALGGDESAAQEEAGTDPSEVSRLQADPEQVERGKLLFQEGCSSCHGIDAGGVEDVAPDLHGVGALAADFYLSTGRMPLDNPDDEPVRSQPRYPQDQIDAIVAYIGSLGGPAIPEPDLSKGDLAEGFKAFLDNCSGCHQAVARGGVVTGAFAPSLADAEPNQVAEAVRMGPYLMPRFPKKVIDDETLNSLVLYVEHTKDPEHPGGWGIAFLGPIPEGMIAWLLALVALLIVARLIGERLKEPPAPPGRGGGR